jgi:two-component system sensor histidine kinase KdpD
MFLSVVNKKLLQKCASHLAGALNPPSLLQNRNVALRRAGRLIAAVGIIAVILALFLRISYIGKTAIVLTLLLAVLGISTRWGFAEALAAAIAAGLFVEYFVIPPLGLGLGAPQHWIALSAFIVTAVTTSELSIRARKKEHEARERRKELESLYAFSQAILQNGTFESTLDNVVRHIVKIFGVEAASLYYAPTGWILRAGAASTSPADDSLHFVAESGSALFDAITRTAIVPIHLHGRTSGSLGFWGGNFSQTAANAVAQRVDIALETAGALEEAARSEAARRSEELKSVVLDALAHDIKTPLAAVKAAVTCLLSGDSNSSPADFELLCVINEETDRLTNEAVEMARVEVGIPELNRRQYSIRETVYSALEDLNSAAAGRHIEINIPDSLPPVDIDFCLVKQVFKQLLDNAVKYSPEDSPIVICSECNPERVVVMVSDSGPGIPESEQTRVFEKCYRGCSSGQRTPGTGMGLAIAKSIVEKHDGRIWVTNGSDRGAVFHVSFPFHKVRVS